MHTDTTRHKEDENSSGKRETQSEMYKPLNAKENRNVLHLLRNPLNHGIISVIKEIKLRTAKKASCDDNLWK